VEVHAMAVPGNALPMRAGDDEVTSALRTRVAELEKELAKHISTEAHQANEALRARAAELEAEVAGLRAEAASQQVSVLKSSEGGEGPLLAAAYQQISVLNTQLAHLYTELTMARTEAQHFRAEREAQAVQGIGLAGESVGNASAQEGELLKQNQQIADLVGDIRHLQLDLEYHQKKLDSMIEEKQAMMQDLKKTRMELVEIQALAEERGQMLRHREVDLQHLKQELKTPRQANEGESVQVVNALRTEAAAKDSALIVSHYELQKEKLLRDRLEQKNMKLMERMQKLMMIVETMRKENVSLERHVADREETAVQKEVQLRHVTQKAKQLQRLQKAPKQSARGKSAAGVSLELDAQGHVQPPSANLPPLEIPSRSLDSAGGQSGGSQRKCPPSPYISN